MSKDRPTILQIIPQLDAGGAELSVVEIASAVVRAGGRALVLAEPGRLAADITAAGGEVMPFPAATKNPLRMLANARHIVQIAAQEGVDLIHARSRAPAWSALRAARQARLPFVTTYHGAYRERSRAKRLYNSVMARGDVVIANSGYTAGLIKARYGTPAERLVVIHRGVDTSRYDPAQVPAERVAALRQAWGVAPDQRVILHPARLTRWKGQGVVIDAAARLKADGGLEDAVVVLAGDHQGRDGYVAELRGRIEQAGLADKVRLAGHVTDMAAAYVCASVTVVASVEPEAFGRTAIEAAALGCPVIATDIGAPPETVLADAAQPGARTGWLVPPDDPAALARHLAEALALALPDRAGLAARARARAVDHFSIRAMQLSTLGVYDRLLGTRLEARLNAAAPNLPLDRSVSVSLERS